MFTVLDSVDELSGLVDLVLMPNHYGIIDVETVILDLGDTTMKGVSSSERVMLKEPDVVDLCWLDTRCSVCWGRVTRCCEQGDACDYHQTLHGSKTIRTPIRFLVGGHISDRSRTEPHIPETVASERGSVPFVIGARLPSQPEFVN